MNITFFYLKVEYRTFDESVVRNWLKEVIKSEKKIIGKISYNFVSESEILKMNIEHLKHDYFTDIITFDNSFVNIINGDIFISTDTVLSNAENMGISDKWELYRVIVHGIMHLCKYSDSTDEEKVIMRKLEDKYLAYLEKI